MVSLLPNELILEISDNFDIFTIMSIISINKNYRRFFLTKKIRLMTYIKRIQKLYKNNLPRTPVLPTAPSHRQVWLEQSLNKSLLVRIYIASYPMKFLKNYPEFLVKKINAISDNNKNVYLKNYVNNKMPPADKRTRRDIKTFLHEPLISSYNILYTGW